MSFYLDGEFINETYIRYILLNNGKAPDENDNIHNNGIDSSYADMDNTMEEFLEKLITKDIEKTNEQFLTEILDNLNMDNINMYSSLLTFNRHHLVATLYLLYEGRISESELETIMSATTLKSRTEILLSFLNSEGEKLYVDLFKPLKIRIGQMMNYTNNPTEVDIAKIRKLREELKYKKFNLKTQYFNQGNLAYADLGDHSPFYLTSNQNESKAGNHAQYDNILTHNFFNINMFPESIITLTDDKLIKDEYANYISKTGNGQLSYQDYKTDILNGCRILDFYKKIETNTKLENGELVPDPYSKNSEKIELGNVFISSLYDIIEKLVDKDFNNRMNIHYEYKTPQIENYVKYKLQENFNLESPDAFKDTSRSYTGTALSEKKRYISNFIKIEDDIQRKNYLKNKILRKLKNKNKTESEIRTALSNTVNTYPISYLFNKINEKEYDKYMEIDLLIDDDGNIVNFGRTNVLYYVEKITNFISRKLNFWKLIMKDVIERYNDGLYGKVKAALAEFRNPLVLESEQFLFDLSKQIVANYIEYLFLDTNNDDSTEKETLSSVFTLAIKPENLMSSKNVDSIYREEEVFNSTLGRYETKRYLKKIADTSSDPGVLLTETENKSIKVVYIFSNNNTKEYYWNGKVFLDEILFSKYKNLFNIRHTVIRFNDAIELIKTNPIYEKMLTDPCNCNHLFDKIAEYMDYLKYNRYFQTNYNRDNISSFDFKILKTHVDGFGGIL